MAAQDATHDEAVRRDGGARPPARAALLSWDWKGQPDLDELSEALRELAGLHLYRVETGTEDTAIMITTKALDDDAVQAVWDSTDDHFVDLAD